MSLKKTIGFISALLTAATLTVSSVAYAELKENEIEVKPKVKQYDDICGSVKVSILPNANVYVKITKHTPETSEEGYVIYDTTVKASDVYDDCKSVMGLEGNNYNIEAQEYDGYYDVSVGVHKHIGSDDPEDIMYQNIYLIVTDKDVSGYDTVCDINITLSDKDMDEPQMAEMSDGSSKKYDLVFPYLEMPKEPEPEPEPDVLSGDANEDGKVNIRDAAFMASMLAAGQGDKLPKSADFNQDGAINIRDAAALASSLSKKK